MLCGTLLAPPLTGALFDARGTFTLAALLAGGAVAVNWLLLLPLPKTRDPVGAELPRRLQPAEEGR